jgi:filamentous hemagglutinin
LEFLGGFITGGLGSAGKIGEASEAANAIGEVGAVGNLSKIGKGAAKTNFPISKGSSVPVPEATKVNLNDGTSAIYKSNPKHTKGQEGNRPNAGIEPKDSLSLFQSSVLGSDGRRYVLDSNGNLNRFDITNVGTNEWHWNGGTGQGANSLSKQKIPKDIITKFNLPKKGW